MANLSIGSSGSGVQKWQNYLISEGYAVTADGIFGKETEAATKDYQTSKGLKADGIVGSLTLGTVNQNKATTFPEAKPLPTTPTYDTTSWDDTTKGKEASAAYDSAKDAVNDYGDFTYDDYEMGEDATAAKDALDAHNANKPGEYQSQWQNKLDTLMNQIMNRDKFSYDLNGDALYQQYKDKYIQQGKLAMADTMGQAAAMTGGYGSSYAQSVGQQAYQSSLDNLNDIVPELYQMALNQYNQEGQDLYNQYGLVMDRENTDYGRYRDTVGDWQNDRNYLQGVYSDERSFDYGKYSDDRNLDFSVWQDGYNKLMDALEIAQSDYYDGADMFYTEQGNKNSESWNKYNAEFNEWRANTADDQWQKGFDREGEWHAEDTTYNAGKDYVESGGTVGYNNGALSDDQVKEMQKALGINADGKWGSGSTEAAGGLTADQAWKAYQEGKLGKTDVSYEDIEEDLNYFISQGADKSEINSYLREALKSGYITQDEYNKLKELYAPRGQIYGTGGGGGKLTVQAVR